VLIEVGEGDKFTLAVMETYSQCRFLALISFNFFRQVIGNRRLPGQRVDGVLGLLQRERPYYSLSTRLMFSWTRSKASGPMPAPPRKG
jgi:hypothetical protein